jgi:hypothetical protein
VPLTSLEIVVIGVFVLASIDPVLQWALPFLVTVGALVVGWRQLSINKKQVRLQSREKRLAVYKASMTLIALAIRNGTVTQEEWHKFARATKEVGLLFDKKMNAYCRELYKHAVDVGVAHQVMETAPSSPYYNQSVRIWSTGMEWFTDQATEAEKRFKPFLRVND